MGEKDSHRLPVPRASTSEGPPLVNVAVPLTAREPPEDMLCGVDGIGWLLDTQVQLVGLTVFLVWKDLMGPPLMALNIAWGDRSVL